MEYIIQLMVCCFISIYKKRCRTFVQHLFSFILIRSQHTILSKEKKMDTISITFINLETINIHFNGYLLHFRGDVRYHLF